MAKKNFFRLPQAAGTLAMVLALVFGPVLAGCPTEDNTEAPPSRDSALVGKWYNTQEAANAATGTASFEFKADGKCAIVGQEYYTWTASGGNLTITQGAYDFVYPYVISGTKLTLSEQTSGPNGASSFSGDYFKKAD